MTSQADPKEVQADSKEAQADSKEVQADSKEVQADSKEVQADSKEVQADSKEAQADSKEAQAPPKKAPKNSKPLSPEEIKAKRYELLNQIISRETFIDPMVSEEITKAYSVYEKDPSKILKVVVYNFLQYCRKCIREAALVEHKNELSHATFDEAEQIRTEVTDKYYEKVKNDPELEQLLLMLIFKNTFWNWVRFGLKDIFNEQRRQPGHPINNYLNSRFHKLKTKKNFKIVGDLVMADITEIVNAFKHEVMQRKVKIFD